LTVQPLLDIN
ncbi:DNA-directed RNA polymerase 7 kDa subunit, partial [Monkeypox virus]